MNPKEVAKHYIQLLEQGSTEAIIQLFSENGQVYSPIYGVKSAKNFYRDLSDDTNNSELKVKGLFTEEDSSRLAIYFEYQWTLKNGQIVLFDVVDILEFDDQNKIVELKIIYDTVQSRAMVESMKKD